MPADLTAKMDPDDARQDVYGMHCPEHPDQDRYGLTMPHAQNAIRKHNREQHPDPVFQVHALAAMVLAAYDDLHEAMTEPDEDKAWTKRAAQVQYDHALAAWMTLLGLPLSQREFARTLARFHSTVGTVAHAAPF